jgi:hypothetical protein
MVDADPGRCGIVHRHQHGIRFDAVGPFFVDGLVALIGRLGAAHTGSDKDAGRVTIAAFEQGAGVGDGLGGGNQSKLADTIQHAQARRAEMRRTVERHGCDHPAGQARIEIARQSRDTRASLHESTEEILRAVTEWRNDAQARNGDSIHCAAAPDDARACCSVAR